MGKVSAFLCALAVSSSCALACPDGSRTLDVGRESPICGRYVELGEGGAVPPYATMIEQMGLDWHLWYYDVDGLGDAIAFKDEDGERFIAVDAGYTQSGNPTLWTLIVLHELGHHVCGHVDRRLSGVAGNFHDDELEADRFAGAAMSSLNTGTWNLPQLREETMRFYPTVSTQDHPASEDRLLAIALGWNHGMPAACQR